MAGSAFSIRCAWPFQTPSSGDVLWRSLDGLMQNSGQMAQWYGIGMSGGKNLYGTSAAKAQPAKLTSQMRKGICICADSRQLREAPFRPAAVVRLPPTVLAFPHGLHDTWRRWRSETREGNRGVSGIGDGVGWEWAPKSRCRQTPTAVGIGLGTDVPGSGPRSHAWSKPICDGNDSWSSLDASACVLVVSDGEPPRPGRPRPPDGGATQEIAQRGGAFTRRSGWRAPSNPSRGRSAPRADGPRQVVVGTGGFLL